SAECPEYEVHEKLASAVGNKIANDKAAENEIASAWASEKERKHAELVTRLAMEGDRLQRLKDRGLGASKHTKKRIAKISDQLLALGYSATGGEAFFADNAPTGENAPRPVARPGPRVVHTASVEPAENASSSVFGGGATTALNSVKNVGSRFTRLFGE
ncbi:MAG: hypothetical protein AAFW47_07415, partial [Pseudomonadota bacterium]